MLSSVESTGPDATEAMSKGKMSEKVDMAERCFYPVPPAALITGLHVLMLSW